jgi:hypothetical protein
MTRAASPVRISGRLVLIALTAAVVGPAVPGQAADPNGGGDLRTSVIRAELFEEWDLDNDGKISKPEADLARARMKRERLEMQLGGGIDPLTGLPRGDDAEPTEPEEAAEEPLFRLPPELPPVEPARRSGPPTGFTPSMPTLPGSPRGFSSTPKTLNTPGGPKPPTMPKTPGSNQPATTSAGSPRTVSSRASWLPPQRFGPAGTGGVRAGAPAAVPGYGSGAWADLNAGRQRFAPQLPAAPGTSSATTGTGGLLPQRRADGRTGAILLPSANGAMRQPGTIRPAAPPPPLMPAPRIRAEEIGGYRP